MIRTSLPAGTMALMLFLAAGANAQTMGPHLGPVCPGPGQVYIMATPACGVNSAGFRAGRFQRVYQSTGNACIPQEYFLGCQPG